ncbi:MAG: ABC transporter permease [Desulfovibrionaceae bacterium]|nr:ABC transporter permease [Desulfovibrionaceae bacterium]
MRHKNILYYFDLFFVLTKKEFVVQYKASIIGYLWSVLSPLAQGLVFFLAFGIFMRFSQENYLLFLLSALYPWQWVSNSMGHAPKIFLAAPSLVKKVYFPRFFIPLTNCFQHMLHCLLALPAYMFFLLLYGIMPTPKLLIYVPLLILVSYAIIAPLGLALACLNVYVRDLENIMPLILQLLFFLTPIVYPLDVVPERIRFLLYCNPFFPVIAAWRSVLLNQAMPWDLFGASCMVALAACVIGAYIYKKLSWKLAELL